MCGSCLEQTTWLRRNLAVKEQDDETSVSVSVVSGTSSEVLAGNSHSVQAQLVSPAVLTDTASGINMDAWKTFWFKVCQKILFFMKVSAFF